MSEDEPKLSTGPVPDGWLTAPERRALSAPPTEAPQEQQGIYTHCSHGKSYRDEECAECEIVWAQEVTLPMARNTVAKLLKFYSAESLIALIFAQDHHIEKLQAKLPPLRDARPRRVREG